MTQYVPDAVDLITVPNEVEAGVIRSVLEDAGIESWTLTSANTPVGIWGASAFNFTTIQVLETEYDRAQEVLNRTREESIDLNWESIDIGEPEDELAAEIASGRRPPLFRQEPYIWQLVAVLFLTALLTGWLIIAAIMLPFILVGAYRYWVRRHRYRHDDESDTESRIPAD